jgi:ATP/ADP translocase
MLAGNLLAALLYVPIYQAMKAFSDPVNPVALTALVFIQVVFVTMVYGPIAAFLVEAFPAKIRYTSLSLPYHFANGWFGGFLPLIATALVARTGNIYAGLAFPIVVALLTVVVGSFLIHDRHKESIWAEVHDPGNPTVTAAVKA